MATTVLNTNTSEVQNKVPSISGLVKKTDYDAKTKDIEEKYFTTADYDCKSHTWCNDKTKSNMIEKLININKKITSNKTKHTEGHKKLTDLTKKFAQISEKWYDFLLGRMYFTANDGYQNFLIFLPMHSSLILDSNRKVGL